MGLYIQGLTMGLAYIAPIGMQNLFVINSALTRTRRNALITALIVIFFDMALSLSCFFGIGALMQANPWLETIVLGLGGLVVIRIGMGLVLPKRKRQGDAAGAEPVSAAAPADQSAPSKHLGMRGLLDTIGTACAVTWFNPQAIIDGTLMLGAFAATLNAGQTTPFITGVETASVLWFLGVTLVVNAFAHKFSPKVIDVLNRVCGGVITLYGIKLLVDFVLAVL
ncbi:L-lysine permease [Bifidobacterium sp. UTCIF-37]|uniref:Amino acid transporter n=1 Tax=Bifidobacterium callitrichos TaxID=762209 RepID=A0A2T3GAR3_9BIFI|nr:MULTISPECIES: LysE family transporter [Bifidobacterium]KAA8816340.1 amino acid transporter [Bifidobacterium callitrichos]PST46576.1 L-lysine permease [Bifidobacterium callitrichos]TPF86862.1 L-lysine permease [Bifidobacterium sp. UTCIF-37]TPF90445.1 L-lysine permease [Bifidobacterium sp. UTCIF-38]